MTIVSILKVVLVMLLWAACYPLITAGIQLAPHMSFAALRALLAGSALTLVAMTLRRPAPKQLRDWGLLALIGFGATSLGFVGMFHAAAYVAPGVATVIANTQPLLAAVLAGAVLKERLTPRGAAGLALGFLGIVVIASPQLLSGGSRTYLLGVGFIVLAALGITIGNVLIKRIAGRVDAMMAMGLQMLMGSLPLMLTAALTERPADIHWSFAFIWILLALGLLGTALAYWLWFSVLEATPLNQANAFSFLTPIFGLAMGSVFYREVLDWPVFVGAGLTFLGVGLMARGGTVASEATVGPDDRSKP